MASLENRNGNYRIVFRVDGQKYSRSLQTSNEKAALGALARLEDNLRRVELGTLVIPPDADVATFLLSDAQCERRVAVPASVTLGAAFDRFFESLPAGNLEDSTICAMKIHRRHLERLLGTRFRLRAVTFDDLQGYVTERAREKGRRGKLLHPDTIKKEIATLRGIWNWMRMERPFPNKGLRYPKEAEKPPFQTWAEIERQIEQGNLSEEAQADLWDCLFLTLDEIDEVLKHVEETARQPFIYPMYVMAAHTGARRSELLRSQVTDFNGDTVTIRERKRVRGKQSTRRVPLSAELRHVMDEWFANHPGGAYTFCHVDGVLRSQKNGRGPRPVTPDEAHDHFKRPLLGSKWEKIRGWHCFRHSFCSNCAMKGIDQRIIDAWVGHTTEDMRRRYRHLFPNSEKEAMGLVFG